MSIEIDVHQVWGELSQLREAVQTLAQKIDQLVTEREKPTLFTEHPYIVCSDKMHRGEPTIRGSAITVRTVVERMRLGDSVQDIVDAYPVLTLAQVHDALGYYYDHVDEIEQYIAENEEAAWRTPKHLSS
jgi:uncharacterized protein (DUF433 family)